MNTLSAGTIMLAADGRSFSVPETLAATFQAGDRLIADRVAGLLHIPARELDRAKQAVDVASAAFSAMHRVADGGHRRLLWPRCRGAGRRCRFGPKSPP